MPHWTMSKASSVGNETRFGNDPVTATRSSLAKRGYSPTLPQRTFPNLPFSAWHNVRGDSGSFDRGVLVVEEKKIISNEMNSQHQRCHWQPNKSRLANCNAIHGGKSCPHQTRFSLCRFLARRPELGRCSAAASSSWLAAICMSHNRSIDVDLTTRRWNAIAREHVFGRESLDALLRMYRTVPTWPYTTCLRTSALLDPNQEAILKKGPPSNPRTCRSPFPELNATLRRAPDHPSSHPSERFLLSTTTLVSPHTRCRLLHHRASVQWHPQRGFHRAFSSLSRPL